MYVFLKRRFLFSHLVLLKIIKAVTRCIFSVVIEVCSEIELILKSTKNSSASQNMLYRIKTNSIDNDLDYTRSQVSYSVDRNIKTVSVSDSNLSRGKRFTEGHIKRQKVVAISSDINNDDPSIIQNRTVTIENATSPVCLKFGNTFPGTILEFSIAFGQGSKTLQSRTVQHKTNGIKKLPQRKHRLKNAEQVLIDQTCNASAGSSCLKLNTSNKVHKLNLNESSSSENNYSEGVFENIPRQTIEHGNKSPLVDVKDPRGHLENKIIQKSEKKYFEDSECNSDLVTAVAGEDYKNEKQISIENECHSEFVISTHNVSQCNQDMSEEQNSFDDECHSELVTALEKSLESHNNTSLITGTNSHSAFQFSDNRSEKLNSLDDECLSELDTAMPKASQCNDNMSEENSDDDESNSELFTALNKVFQWRNSNCENQKVESEKNEHIRENNYPDTKKVGETMEEVKIKAPKRGEGNRNLTTCLYLFPNSAVCLDGTVFHSDLPTNPEQALTDKTRNASAGSSSLKLNTSFKVYKLCLNELSSSENNYFESVLENKIIQKSEKKYFDDHECNSDLVAAVAGKVNESEKQISTHDECHSELITSTPNAFQCDHNVSEELNSIHDKRHSALVTALQKPFQWHNNPRVMTATTLNNGSQCDENVSKKQSSIDDEWHSVFFTALQKALHQHKNDSEKKSVESGKIGHIKGNNYQDSKQVGVTKDKVKINVPKRDNDLASCLHRFPTRAVCSDGTVLPSDVATNPEKGDTHCPVNLTIDEEFNKLQDKHASNNRFIDNEINSASHLYDYNSANGNDFQSTEAAFNLSKIDTSEYIKFLREINPFLQEIETELLNLSKVHYGKSPISEDKTRALTSNLASLMIKSGIVNAGPYHKLVLNYVADIIRIVYSIPSNTEDCTGNSSLMKRSYYLKQVTRMLTEIRNILFHTNEETKVLQKQIQKIGKIPPKTNTRQLKNKRRK